MKIHFQSSYLLLAGLLAAAGCADEETAGGSDATPAADARVDAGHRDAATPAADAMPRADAAAAEDASAPAPDAAPIDGGVTSTTADCPLTDRAKTALASTVDQMVTTAGAVASHASAREAAFVIALPATEGSFQNFAFLIDECRESMAYDPYCQGPGEPGTFFADRDMCMRMSCEAAGIGIYDLWLTMTPHTAIDDLHPFTYETTTPAGEGRMDPNPRITWRADLRTPDEVHVSGRVAWNLTITATGTADVVADFVSFTTADRIIMGATESISVRTAMTFPRLADDGVAVTVTATVTSAHVVTGVVEHDGVAIGAVGAPMGTGSSLGVAWTGACR